MKEDKFDYWMIIPLDGGIEEFYYEVGYEYLLRVSKIHLANPSSDGFDVRYKLLETASQEKR